MEKKNKADVADLFQLKKNHDFKSTMFVGFLSLKESFIINK